MATIDHYKNIEKNKNQLFPDNKIELSWTKEKIIEYCEAAYKNEQKEAASYLADYYEHLLNTLNADSDFIVYLTWLKKAKKQKKINYFISNDAKISAFIKYFYTLNIENINRFISFPAKSNTIIINPSLIKKNKTIISKIEEINYKELTLFRARKKEILEVFKTMNKELSLTHCNWDDFERKATAIMEDIRSLYFEIQQYQETKQQKTLLEIGDILAKFKKNTEDALNEIIKN